MNVSIFWPPWKGLQNVSSFSCLFPTQLKFLFDTEQRDPEKKKGRDSLWGMKEKIIFRLEQPFELSNKVKRGDVVKTISKMVFSSVAITNSQHEQTDVVCYLQENQQTKCWNYS